MCPSSNGPKPPHPPDPDSQDHTPENEDHPTHEQEMADATGELTLLLDRWSRGDRHARDTLVRRLLPELRRLAAGHLSRERPGHTLQPTALVNEVYLRLLQRRTLHFERRNQFFAFASEMMRNILVDRARAYKTKKRGEGQDLLPLHEVIEFAPEKSDEILQLNDALRDLEHFDPDGAKVVELRYFMGLTHQEIADALGTTRIMARRRWEEARAWLYLQMNPGGVD